MSTRAFLPESIVDRGTPRFSKPAIRESHGPPKAISPPFHLGLTLEAVSRVEGESTLEDARLSYQQAAHKFDRLGKTDSAAVARKRLQMAIAGGSGDV